MVLQKNKHRGYYKTCTITATLHSLSYRYVKAERRGDHLDFNYPSNESSPYLSRRSKLMNEGMKQCNQYYLHG